ncbi:MAG TPA: hypothetical protein VG406_26625 [Isosphaeraceae bacterium]|jgi:hypothetical protein|nr:hypothetical protein [Isosphaeraceae bacterium]
MRRTLAPALLSLFFATAHAQTPKQPKVAPGPMEPNWDVVLEKLYGLKMYDDLKNPVTSTPEATPGLFKKAGPGPVAYRPAVALGLETTTRGGWYTPGTGGKRPQKRALWSYQRKNTTRDIETGANLPPRPAEGSTTEFDPGDAPFGLWVSNDGLDDGGVFTEPGAVAAINKRLAKQPYKAMIYPNKDKTTGKFVPHSYIIGWEYSTNDDFQDVVTRVDNVDLVNPDGSAAK